MTRIIQSNLGETGILDERGLLADAFTHLVDDPPWDWLEAASGVVAWANTAAAAEVARDEMKTLFGSMPAVVDRVVDRTFAANIARQRAIDPGIAELVREAEPSTFGVEGVVASWPAWAQAQFAFFVRNDHRDFRVLGKNGTFRFTNPEGLVPWNLSRGMGVVEPWPDRVREFTSAWFIDGHGEPHCLGLVEQHDDALHFELGAYGFFANFGHDEEAIERARIIVEAASKREYRGVCAVEGYTFRTDSLDWRAHVRAVAAFRPRFTAAHVALGLALRTRSPAGTRFRFVVDDAALEVEP